MIAASSLLPNWHPSARRRSTRKSSCSSHQSTGWSGRASSAAHSKQLSLWSIVAWPTCSCPRLPFHCAFLVSEHSPSFRTSAHLPAFVIVRSHLVSLLFMVAIVCARDQRTALGHSRSLAVCSFLSLVHALSWRAAALFFRFAYATSLARRIKKKPSGRSRPPTGPPRSPIQPLESVFDPPLIPCRPRSRHMVLASRAEPYHQIRKPKSPVVMQSS